MVDFEFGVLNWTLARIGLERYDHYDWFANPWEGFAVIAAIVWGAIPFVTITVYAGLTRSREARRSGGDRRRRCVPHLRDITLPILKPIFVILASLSVIWNFQVFTQVWIIRNARPEEDYFLMSVYSFVESFGKASTAPAPPSRSSPCSR